MRYLHLFFSLAVVSFVATASLAFAQVATVFELSGTATASATVVPGSPAAAARTLRQGDGINQGESITTAAKSSIVLRFLDGQIVSLAANSTFAVTTYTYNATNPGQSNVLLSLITGGMRAVTGLIGKARPQAVGYRAAGATIGIRGTDVSIAVNGGTLILSVSTGLVSFAPSVPVGSPPGTPVPAPVSVVAGQGVLTTPATTPGQTATVTVGNPAAIQAALAAAIAQNPTAAPQVANLAAAIVAVVAPNSPTANAVTNAVQSSSAVTAAFNSAVLNNTPLGQVPPVPPVVPTPGQQGTSSTAPVAAPAGAPATTQNQVTAPAVVVPPPPNTGSGSAVAGAGGTPLNCNVVSPATKPAGCP